MKVWGNELELDTGFAQKSLEAARAFIVQHLVLGGESAFGEVGVEDSSGSYVDAVTLVVVRGRSKVPPIDTVVGPGAAVSRCLMDDDSGAGRC